jgi:hypothetical protein
MIEYHVESLGLFQQRMNGLAAGGSLSMRMKDGEQPLIYRHDECIYKQYLLTKKAWSLQSEKK